MLEKLKRGLTYYVDIQESTQSKRCGATIVKYYIENTNKCDEEKA